MKQEVIDAFLLLKSIGVENLCIPQDLDVMNSSIDRLILPRCDEHAAARLLVLNQPEEGALFYAANIFGALASVASVAIIAGLFLGLLTLDQLDLQIIERTSLDEQERVYAATLLPIVQDRHRVLVTLLLLNALAYETLPLFLDALVPTWVAILLSTTIVMLFGEIIPSGIFMGPNQLYLGYKLVPLMRVFLWLMWPFATPLAWLLDYLTETKADDVPDTYNRGELTALIRIQHEQENNVVTSARLAGRFVKKKEKKGVDSTWSQLKAEILERVDDTDNVADEEAPDQAEQLMPPLHKREVDLLEGALKMKTVLAMDVYTPTSHVYMVPDTLVLDKTTITGIYSHGYSRVPVYRPSDDHDDTCGAGILGFLITRQLMLIDWEHNRDMSTLPLQRPVCISPRMNLVDLFEVLQTDGPLMTFVCARPDLANKALREEKPIPIEAGLMGIITLVDLMESILQDRIYDEGDIRDRDRAVATLTRWAATKVQSFIVRAVRKRKRSSSSRTITEDTASATLSEATPLLVNKNKNHSL